LWEGAAAKQSRRPSVFGFIMRITAIDDIVVPISSAIANAYIDF
jgi:hypothetical protein